MIYDFCIIGGGIVGLATAMDLAKRRPGARIALIEKEQSVGQHQTGHNSGVIHSGIYYEPGSLKARLCREGCIATREFCAAHDIPHDICGKLIVATSEEELPRMEALFERAAVNNVKAKRLSAAELTEAEPNIRGVGALMIPETGIVNYRRICEVMADLLKGSGADILLGQPVTAISEAEDQVHIRTGINGHEVICRQLIVCGGLQADRLAHMAGVDPGMRIVPFRGEYFQLPPERNEVTSHLIYPVPDPSLPFLGIHLTRMIDGSVTVGPNAVLALSREGYEKFSLDPRDAWAALTWPGLWALGRRHFRTSIREMRNSLDRKGYLAMCQRYCPSLTLDDLRPYPPGIRAQALTRDGEMIHDFLLRETGRMLHVLNAPSPAATAAIPIGRMIADKVLSEG